MKVYQHNEGYLRVRVDGVTMLQHRYVMEQTLGRKLETWETVHHKDHNKKNNDPTNLELISNAEHSSLHGKDKIKGWITLICPVCDSVFDKELRKYKYQMKKEGAYICCSRKCNGINSHRVKNNTPLV